MLDDAIQQLQRTSDVTEDLLARVSHKYDVTLQARETLLQEREKQLKGTAPGTGGCCSGAGILSFASLEFELRQTQAQAPLNLVFWVRRPLLCPSDTETKLERLQKDTAAEREHLQDLITKLQHNLDSSSTEAKVSLRYTTGGRLVSKSTRLP